MTISPYAIIVLVLIVVSVIAIISGVCFESEHPEQEALEEHKRAMKRRELQ